MKSNLYFKHDLYSIENDSELRYVCSEHPVWGYAVFFFAITIMYRNNGDSINPKILVMDIAHGLFTDNKDKVTDIINDCIEVGLFKKNEDGTIYSSRVIAECQKQSEFSEKQRERVNKRWQNNTNSVPAEYQRNTSGIPTVYQRNTSGNTNKQEQEQEQEQDNNNTSYSSKPSDFDGRAEDDGFSLSSDDSIDAKPVKDATPYKQIVDYWNSHAEGKLPMVVKLTEQRKRVIRSRWKEYGEDVYKAIDKAVSSKWLTDRWNGGSFDWVFSPTNFVKVIEGNYDKDRFKNPSGYGKETFRPKDNTGRYDHIKSEVIEV